MEWPEDVRFEYKLNADIYGITACDKPSNYAAHWEHEGGHSKFTAYRIL